MLRGLTAEQCAARENTPVGDTGDDRADPLRDGAPDRDVVLEEQRLRTADHQVVDNHRDQVQPNGVVFVHGLGDGQFGTHPVGGRGQDRLPVAPPQCEQAGETTQTTAHLGAGGALGQWFE